MTARYLPYVQGCFPLEGFVPSGIVAIDTASRERLPLLHQTLEVDLSIDHHTPGPAFADIHYTDPSAAAAAEIIYELLLRLGVALSEEISLALYVGISTDTGCYRYSNTTARSHQITARLMGPGIDTAPVNAVMFETRSRRRLDIEKRLLGSVRYYRGGKIALGVGTLADVETGGADEDDMESLSALTRQIEGVEIGLLLRETDSGVKLSARTSRNYRADEICRKFGGGGHACAAGATLNMPLEEAEKAVVEIVEDIVGADAHADTGDGIPYRRLPGK